MTDDLDQQLRRFIDGDLSPDDEREALHRIADEPKARRLLRFELQVRETWPPGSTAEVPAGFADRTMAALDTETADARAPASLGQQLQRGWRWLTRPQPVTLRPALGLVAVLVAVALIGVWPLGDANAPSSAPSSSSSVATVASTDRSERPIVWTRFMYTNDEASSVAVAGDFSEWEPIALTAKTVDDRTVWTGLVPVPKGEHQYMFVVDGEKWVTDPLAPIQRNDGFGHKNAVLKL